VEYLAVRFAGFDGAAALAHLLPFLTSSPSSFPSQGGGGGGGEWGGGGGGGLDSGGDDIARAEGAQELACAAGARLETLGTLVGASSRAQQQVVQKRPACCGRSPVFEQESMTLYEMRRFWSNSALSSYM